MSSIVKSSFFTPGGSLLQLLFFTTTLLLSRPIVAALPECVDVLNTTLNTSFVGLCTSQWINLKPYIRPTQSQVGYAWIKYKVDKDFSKASDAQKAMNEGATPTIIGPSSTIENTPQFFITDDHHTLSALDVSGFSATIVTLNVSCDARNVSYTDFWSFLKKMNATLLVAHPAEQPNTLPIRIDPIQLPSSFSFTANNKTLTDDPWRSLVSLARKVKVPPAPAPTCSPGADKYCMKCFYRGCVNGNLTVGPALYYFEFRWSYFLLYAYLNNSFWPDALSYSAFNASYNSLPVHNISFSAIDTAPWLSTAALLIPLCRGSGAGSFQPPLTLFPGIIGLPGYTAGYIELPDDPTCDLPAQCRSDQLPIVYPSISPVMPNANGESSSTSTPPLSSGGIVAIVLMLIILSGMITYFMIRPQRSHSLPKWYEVVQTSLGTSSSLGIGKRIMSQIATSNETPIISTGSVKAFQMSNITSTTTSMSDIGRDRRGNSVRVAMRDTFAV